MQIKRPRIICREDASNYQIQRLRIGGIGEAQLGSLQKLACDSSTDRHETRSFAEGPTCS
jgi:hypothetical protein